MQASSYEMYQVSNILIQFHEQSVYIKSWVKSVI
jgi:hypothetical protein